MKLWIGRLEAEAIDGVVDIFPFFTAPGHFHRALSFIIRFGLRCGRLVNHLVYPIFDGILVT